MPLRIFQAIFALIFLTSCDALNQRAHENANRASAIAPALFEAELSSLMPICLDRLERGTPVSSDQLKDLGFSERTFFSPKFAKSVKNPEFYEFINLVGFDTGEKSCNFLLGAFHRPRETYHYLVQQLLSHGYRITHQTKITTFLKKDDISLKVSVSIDITGTLGVISRD